MIIMLAFLCGIIVTIMNIFNGQLSNIYGIYLSTCLVHLLGLITFIFVMYFKHQQISFKKQLPYIFYTGGIIGVLTVIFSVISINTIGAALLTALGLLGQMITSIILEQKGWLGSLKKTLSPSKCFSLIIVALGIGVMLL